MNFWGPLNNPYYRVFTVFFYYSVPVLLLLVCTEIPLFPMTGCPAVQVTREQVEVAGFGTTTEHWGSIVKNLNSKYRYNNCKTGQLHF